MSDYTPETDEIRSAYHAYVFDYGSRGQDPLAEFDLWLAQYRAEVIAEYADSLGWEYAHAANDGEFMDVDTDPEGALGHRHVAGPWLPYSGS